MLRPVANRWGAGLVGAALTLAWLAGCAEPRVPSGGPRDTTPPGLLSSDPPNEAVNVSGETIRLEFSEYVNQASLQRALSITPAPQGRLRFRWRRRRVDIRLPAALQDSTTYVLVLGTDLRDMQGVALKRPVTLAFSTGDVIDQGWIRGRVIEPTVGAAVPGMDIFAYAIQDATPATLPTYRTQSGEDGSFELAYLREAPYFVVALQDRDRDRQPDPSEAFAAPPEEVIMATPDTMRPVQRWVVARLDTIAPQVSRVRSLSSRRLQVRMSEAVALGRRDPAAWQVEDSLSGEPVTVRSVYLLDRDVRTVLLRTDSLRATTYRLVPDPSVTDSSGNPVRLDTVSFRGVARPDTSALRLTGFHPPDSAAAMNLAPYEVPRITFSEPPGDAVLEDLLSARDSVGTPHGVRAVTTDGTSYTLIFEPPLEAGVPRTMVVRMPSPSESTQLWEHQFDRLGNSELGSLSGIVQPVHPHTIIELRSTERRLLMSTTPDSVGTFTFDGLPLGEFHIRAFIDVNANGGWDGGRLLPFVQPEPIVLLRGLEQVRPRWDTVVSDTLRLPTF